MWFAGRQVPATLPEAGFQSGVHRFRTGGLRAGGCPDEQQADLRL